MKRMVGIAFLLLVGIIPARSQSKLSVKWEELTAEDFRAAMLFGARWTTTFSSWSSARPPSAERPMPELNFSVEGADCESGVLLVASPARRARAASICTAVGAGVISSVSGSSVWAAG